MGDVVSLFYDEVSPIVFSREMLLREFRMAIVEEELYYSNAFAITLFCTTDEFETQAIDMLQVAFEDYPELDYCLCMVPNETPILPLIQAMSCVKVRPGMSFNQSLYVIRKESLVAKVSLTVTRITKKLFPFVEAFLKPLGDEEELQQLLVDPTTALRLSDTPLKDNPVDVSFAVMFDNEVVGVVSLSRKKLANDDLLVLRSNYQLENIIDYERHRGRSQTAITQWIVSPVFSRWSRFILRDIMRQFEKTVFYYQCVKNAAPAAELIEEMRPVGMRRRIQDREKTLVLQREMEMNNAGPLFIIQKNQLSRHKTTVNSRIVIVGGSIYSFYVLEVLCLSPDLTFNNLYLVSDHPDEPTPAPHDYYLSSHRYTKVGEFYSGCLSVRDIEDPSQHQVTTLGIPYKASIVKGHLTDIDRENRSIVISDELALEYDTLIIASPPQGY